MPPLTPAERCDLAGGHDYRPDPGTEDDDYGPLTCTICQLSAEGIEAVLNLTTDTIQIRNHGTYEVLMVLHPKDAKEVADGILGSLELRARFAAMTTTAT